MAKPREKKARGSAPKRVRPGEYVGFRAPVDLKLLLEKAAANAGRSLSSEAQFRLEQSFRDEAWAGEALALSHGERGAALLLLLGQAMNLVGSRAVAWKGLDLEHASWLDNPWAYDQVARALTQIMERARPQGDLEAVKEQNKGSTKGRLMENIGVTIADQLILAVRGQRIGIGPVDEINLLVHRLKKSLAPLFERSGAGPFAPYSDRVKDSPK